MLLNTWKHLVSSRTFPSFLWHPVAIQLAPAPAGIFLFFCCAGSQVPPEKNNFPCNKIVKERINIVDCELHGASTVHEVCFVFVMPSFWKIEAAFIGHKPGSWAHSISSFCFDYFRRYDTMPWFWKIEAALIDHESGSLLWLLWKIWSKI